VGIGEVVGGGDVDVLGGRGGVVFRFECIDKRVRVAVKFFVGAATEFEVVLEDEFLE